MGSTEILPRPWVRLHRLRGDASHRRYARVWDEGDRTAIITHYPKSVRQQMARDLEVRAWCADHGLRVPRLLDHDLDNGWAVMEDFGTDDAECSLRTRPCGEREGRCRRLIRPLIELADVDPSRLPPWNPPLDRDRLRWELAGFELWFLRHTLHLDPSPAVGSWLDDLAETIDGHPQRVCHRDYHLNNLFLLADGSVGLIDYQDILVGPDTYDAVSLLGERGAPRLLTESARDRLRRTWADETRAKPGWRERWRLVRAQRGLKVLGTFARLEVGGSGAYGSWLEQLATEIAPELAALKAPSELVDLLLDLSRYRRSMAAGWRDDATPA